MNANPFELDKPQIPSLFLLPMLQLTHRVPKVRLNTFDLIGLPLYSEAMSQGAGTAGNVKEVTFIT